MAVVTGDFVSGQIPATPETVRRPRLQRLLHYWHQQRGNRTMPARADIDPLHFPWILGNLSLLEVHQGATTTPRYRFRLVGTRVVQRLRYDMTGKWLDELQERQYRSHLHDSYIDVVTQRRPLVERLDMVIDDRLHDYEIVRLPLGADGDTVDMIILAVEFRDPGI